MLLAQTGFGCIALPVVLVLIAGLAIIREKGWIRLTNTQFTLIAFAVTVAVIGGGAYLFGILLGY